jgi:hypothetical protein
MIARKGFVVQFKVRLMWISAHVGIPDGFTKNGAKSVHYYSSVALGCNFYLQIKSCCAAGD